MSWEQVTAADQAHTAALNDLKAAQVATATSLAALQDANATYETALATETEAESAAELAQANLVSVSASVGIDYPPENQPVQLPSAARR